MRYIRKQDPNRDIAAASRLNGGINHLTRPDSAISRGTSRNESLISIPRHVSDPGSGSRTDMATGLRSLHHGFDFSTEENGVAMRRMQTNLSERRQSSRSLAVVPQQSHRRMKDLGHVFSIRRSLLKRKPLSRE